MKKIMFVIVIAVITMMATEKVSAQTSTVKGYILSDMQPMANGNCQFYACLDQRGNKKNTCSVHCVMLTGDAKGQTIWCEMNAGMVAHGNYQRGDDVFINRSNRQLAQTQDGTPVFAVIIGGDGQNHFAQK